MLCTFCTSCHDWSWKETVTSTRWPPCVCVCVFLMCRFYIFVQTYNNWDHKTVSVPAILSTTSMLRLWQQQQMHAVATCMASSA